MRAVRALDGDTIDAIAFREYGRHGMEASVLSANPELAGRVQLAPGTVVRLPDASPAPASDRIRLWS